VPNWVDGYRNGKRTNKSLKIRDWTRASSIIRDWEIEQRLPPAARPEVTVGEACDAFLADVEAQRQFEASRKKYRVLLVNRRAPENREKHSLSLLSFCAEAGIETVTQITLPALSRFRGQWKDGPLSAGKKLERLRTFGRFATDRGWWTENLALKLKRPKVKDVPTMPFTHDETFALLAACEHFPDWRGNVSQANSRRLRAFILFARYSGLRISDAASCAVARLSGHRLFLYTQKTGVPVYIPLPPFVVDALEACPRISESYWFWTGIGMRETLSGNWRRTFRPLCELAGVRGGHPHRFRDTLAVELLLVRKSADGARLRSAGTLVAEGHRAQLQSLGQGTPATA
jgi:integrase